MHKIIILPSQARDKHKGKLTKCVFSDSYGSHGRLVAGFLPASLPDGLAKRLVGLGLCYHIAVSCNA